MLLVVIADEQPMTDETERHLRRLRMQHDVVWLTVSDADPVLDHRSSDVRSDVLTGWKVPDFVHGESEVREEWEKEREAEAAKRAEVLDRWSVSHTTLHTRDDAVRDILRMLERRSRVRH